MPLGGHIGAIIAPVARMVQVAVAGDVAEAEEIRSILAQAGIDAELQAAEDDPLTVLVPEASLEDAKEAIEALTDADVI